MEAFFVNAVAVVRSKYKNKDRINIICFTLVSHTSSTKNFRNCSSSDENADKPPALFPDVFLNDDP